jgi:hypothetical protein
MSSYFIKKDLIPKNGAVSKSSARESWQTSRVEVTKQAMFSHDLPILTRFPSLRSCLWARPDKELNSVFSWRQYLPSIKLTSLAIESLITRSDVTLIGTTKSDDGESFGYNFVPLSLDCNPPMNSVHVRRGSDPPQVSSSVLNASFESESLFLNGSYNLNCLFHFSTPASSLRFRRIYPAPSFEQTALVDALLQSPGLRGLISPVSDSQCGLLTLNSLRHVVPLLFSDPAIRTTPVIGVWLRAPDSCVNQSNLDHQWALDSLCSPCINSLISYYFDTKDIAERVFMPDAPTTILVAILSSHEMQKHSTNSNFPEFFECDVNWPFQGDSREWTGLDVLLQIRLQDNMKANYATCDVGFVTLSDDGSLQWTLFPKNKFQYGINLSEPLKTITDRHIPPLLANSFAANIAASGIGTKTLQGQSTPQRLLQANSPQQNKSSRIPSPKFHVPSERHYSREREANISAFATTLTLLPSSLPNLSNDESFVTKQKDELKEIKFQQQLSSPILDSTSFIPDVLSTSSEALPSKVEFFKLDAEDHETLKAVRSTLEELTRSLNRRDTSADATSIQHKPFERQQQKMPEHSSLWLNSFL